MKNPVTKNTTIFSITSFLTDLSSEMIFPLLPLFLVGVLGASEFEVGLIEGIAVCSIGVFSLFSIHFINKLGNEKRTVIFGYSVSSIMKLGFSIASSWPEILGFRFLERSGKGIRVVARDTLIVLSESKKRIGIAFGIRQAADKLGAILGPLIAGLLLFYLSEMNGFSLEESYRDIFLIAAVPVLIAIPALFFVKQEGEPKKVPLKEIKEYIFEKQNRNFLTLIGTLFFVNFSIMFFVLRAAQFIPAYMVPLAYIGCTALFSLFSVPSGILTDRIGPKKTIGIGLVVYLVALVLFGYFPSVFNIFLGFVLIGIFRAVLEVSSKVLVTKNGNGERYEILFSGYQAVAKMVKLPSNLIAGFLWIFPIFGAPATFAFGIISTLIGFRILGKLKE